MSRDLIKGGTEGGMSAYRCRLKVAQLRCKHACSALWGLWQRGAVR